MLITKENLDALRVTFGAQFQAAYDETETHIDKLATTIPSDGDRNVYGWIAKQLVAREWIGPRIAQNLTEREYILKNRRFEATVSVERDKIEDDNLGLFTSQTMPQLGSAMKRLPDSLLVDVLQGDTPCYDGYDFFATNHPTFDAAGSTFANLFGSNALDAENFAATWAAMASYTGEDGKPLKVNPNALIVPPQLKRTGLEILNAGFAVGAGGSNVTAENVLKGWADVIVIEELANEPTVWYLADLSKGIKPFVNQKRVEAEFVALDRVDDPNVFELDEYRYGARYRGEVGVSLPFLISRSQSAAL